MTWDKPLPQPTRISMPFWEGLKSQQVRIQQCDSCRHWVFFPRAHCPHCGGTALTWRPVSGEGTLYTYTVTHVPTLPEFRDETPQLLAVVELDEGPRLNTALVGVEPSELVVGMRLRPVFDMRPGDITLLRYTPKDSTHASFIPADRA